MINSILTFLFYAFSFIFMLGIIVLLHELGHFLVAKKFGIYCSEFSLGMGPLVYSKQKGETKYSIRLFPIGGFVAIAGDDDVENADEIPFERTLPGVKWWKQICVMLAGVLVNVILAWVVFVGVTFAQGKVTVTTNHYQINEVVKNSVASKSGFKSGDIITKVKFGNDSYNINEPSDLNKAMAFNPNEKGEFTVVRNSKTIVIKCTPAYDEKNQVTQLGVINKMKIKKINFIESIGYGTKSLIDNTSLVFESLNRIIHGQNLKQLSGPVGIFKMTGDVAKGGIFPWLTLLAILSINIGIFNLLPIPVLDGGRALMVLIEKITGRKINEKIVNFLMNIGMLLLFALLIFATFNDVGRLF